MTREERIKRLEASIAFWDRLIPIEMLKAEKQTHFSVELREDMRIALAALRGPQADPDTGLVPCGCGGKAKIWPSDPTQFTHVITDYEVGCTECAMTTGWVRGKQENAMKVWNTAMGWKGGSK